MDLESGAEIEIEAINSSLSATTYPTIPFVTTFNVQGVLAVYLFDTIGVEQGVIGVR